MSSVRSSPSPPSPRTRPSSPRPLDLLIPTCTPHPPHSAHRIPHCTEHMEDDNSDHTFPHWIALEYAQMLRLAHPSIVIFSSLSPNSVKSLSEQLIARGADPKQFRAETRSVQELMQAEGVELNRVCLLDPRAESEVGPEDGKAFDWFLPYRHPSCPWLPRPPSRSRPDDDRHRAGGDEALRAGRTYALLLGSSPSPSSLPPDLRSKGVFLLGLTRCTGRQAFRNPLRRSPDDHLPRHRQRIRRDAVPVRRRRHNGRADLARGNAGAPEEASGSIERGSQRREGFIGWLSKSPGAVFERPPPRAFLSGEFKSLMIVHLAELDSASRRGLPASPPTPQQPSTWPSAPRTPSSHPSRYSHPLPRPHPHPHRDRQAFLLIAPKHNPAIPQTRRPRHHPFGTSSRPLQAPIGST
ncbi:SPOSA6832_01104, partial [Sporobolomyces salmonicolor]